MNKIRRKAIDEIIIKLRAIMEDELPPILEAEEEALNNMPDSIRGTLRGETMESAIDALDSAMTNIEDVIDFLNEAKGDE